jgi:predicted GH43/DUF377 family glycosyl hydrolase
VGQRPTAVPSSPASAETRQRWEKLGRVYVASGEQPWARSHATLPTPFLLDDERIRIYVAFLDAEGIGRLGYVELDARDPLRVLAVSPSPVLDIGRPGTFDENGVTPMTVLRHEGRCYLFYTGWQLGRRVRYYMFTGLAVSDDDGATFRRVSEAPVLERSDGELFVRTAAHVRRDGSSWRIWYAGGDRWIDLGGKQVPSYDLRHARSERLDRWPPAGEVVLVPRDDEYGFGRPWVVGAPGGYQMWYSIRSRAKGYRLGYAESVDGLAWQRRDGALGLDVAASGWDAEMICYSSLQPTRYGTYLFYNGNNYGETGFGVAVRRDDSVATPAPQ